MNKKNKLIGRKLVRYDKPRPREHLKAVSAIGETSIRQRLRKHNYMTNGEVVLPHAWAQTSRDYYK